MIYSLSNFRFILIYIVKFVPITSVILPKINLEHLELLRPWGFRVSSLEAPGLHDANLNTPSIQNSKGRAKNCLDNLKKSSKSKSLIYDYEKGFKL